MRLERLGGWPTVAGLLGGVLVVYYGLPIASLLAAQPPGDVLARLDDPRVVGAAVTSLTSSIASTVLAALFGVPLAYWLARADGRLADAVSTVVVLPLVLPPIVSGLVLLSVFGEGSPLGAVANRFGLRLTRSFLGVVLAQTFVASPFVVLTSRAAFAGVDPDLVDAARTLGADSWGSFRRVSLPLALPGVLAGVTLTFARAIGEFGATLTVAYYPRTMPVQIRVSARTGGIDAAYAIAVIQLGIALLALLALAGLGRLGSIPVR